MRTPCQRVETSNGIAFEAVLTVDQLLEVCKPHDPQWPSESADIEPQLAGERRLVVVLTGKRWQPHFSPEELTLHQGDVLLEREVYFQAKQLQEAGHGARSLQLCFVREGDFYTSN